MGRRSNQKWKEPAAGAFGSWTKKEQPDLPTPHATVFSATPPEPWRAKGFVSLDALKNAVLKPGIDMHLRPLTLYRGRDDMGRIKRLWNYLQLMHLAGVESASSALKLFQNDEVSHLLGPVNKPSLLSLETFLSRVADHYEVASLIHGLPAYIKEQIAFRRFNLQRCPGAAPRSKVDWRREAGQVAARQHATERAVERAAAPKQIFYPYMIHDPLTDESRLVAAVNRVVPRWLSPDMRADVAQEMLVAVLTGEIGRDQIHSKRYEIMKRVMRMNGWNDGALSLDAPFGYSGRTLMEMLADTEWVDPWADPDDDGSGFLEDIRPQMAVRG